MAQPKVKSAAAVGIGGGALVAWVWGLLSPETPMPPEVAAIIAGFLGAITGPMMRWLEGLGAP